MLILFTLQESPQASTGFSPFELLYERQPQGLLEVLEGERKEPGEPAVQEAEPYMAQLQQHLHTLRQLACNNLARAQAAQKGRYDQGTQDCSNQETKYWSLAKRWQPHGESMAGALPGDPSPGALVL